MRDATRMQFSSNSPMKNYVALSERMDEINRRLREAEQMAIEAIARLNQIESR